MGRPTLDDPRKGRQFYLSGNLATMAPGLPYAIGMQLAFPGRQVIAYVGDCGFAMLMAEFLTACRAGLPIIVVVNNNSLGQILWEQMVLGYPRARRAVPVACGGLRRLGDSLRRVRGQGQQPQTGLRPSPTRHVSSHQAAHR